MEHTGIDSKVIEEIIQIAKRHDIKKVILFGSRARGDYHRASDIDLAVLDGNIDSFAIDIEEETSTLLRFDVINLNQKIDEKLLDSIKREGITIYE